MSVLPPRTMWIGAAQITGQMMAVVTAVLLARRLGVEGFGIYAFATVTIFVVNVVTTFGTDLVLIREVARDGRLDRCAAALGLQLWLSVAAIAVIAAGSLAFGSGDAGFAAPTRIYALSLLPSAFFSVISATLRGLGLLRAYAGLVFAAAATPLAAVVAFVRHGTSLERTMLVLLAAQVVVALVAVACCIQPIRTARPSLRMRHSDMWNMAQSSGTVGALGLVGVVYQRLAMLGVSLLVGPAATGWFSGASRIVEGSKVGHVALATASYPLMAQGQAGAGAGAGAGAVVAVRRSWTACLALGAIVSIVLLVAGPSMVSWLYGDGFEPSGRGLRILALGVVPSTVATFRALSMLAEHREREVLQTVAVSASVLAGLLLVLVPMVGWIGACWALTIADVTQAIALTIRQRTFTARTEPARLVEVMS